jgi:putative DNA modification/repair radical SAM protein
VFARRWYDRRVSALAAKLTVLADSAKYDASCASTRTARDPAAAPGICHSYTPDGRCVSLLKVLLTNYCIYDCAYCVNRVSNDLPRARFAVDEIVGLTVDFYRRNYIDGLFLSSGVIQSPDYTMEQIVAVARTLRTVHEFAGYIHLKAMPGVSQDLIAEAGRWADRLSVNIELPTAGDLRRLAPDKSHERIEQVMAGVRTEIDAASDAAASTSRTPPPPYASAGQTTQMIVGASDARDADVLATADRLYQQHDLRRVYYTAYSPIPGQETLLAGKPTPLVREHRLYQADQLVRQYGFATSELVSAERPDLELEVDPKLAWALRHPEWWPVDVNTAGREALLRVPGFGRRTVARILAARRHGRLRRRDLVRIGARLRHAASFILTADSRPATQAAALDAWVFLSSAARQLTLQF